MTSRPAVVFQLRSMMVDLKRALPTLVACLALGAFGAGCGGDDEEEDADGGAAPAQEPAEEPAGGGGSGAKAVKVDMKDTTYVPMDVSVAKGGSITWTNSDGFAHTVTKEEGPGADFDSGNVDGGGTFKQKFSTAGVIDYVCSIHASQTGTITVK